MKVSSIHYIRISRSRRVGARGRPIDVGLGQHQIRDDVMMINLLSSQDHAEARWQSTVQNRGVALQEDHHDQTLTLTLDFDFFPN